LSAVDRKSDYRNNKNPPPEDVGVLDHDGKLRAVESPDLHFINMPFRILKMLIIF